MAATTDFSKCLRLALDASTLSQRQFAEKCGFSHGLVQGMLSGRNTPPKEKVERMIRLLALSAPDAERFREAALASHSHAGLVSDFKDRGRRIAQLEAANKTLGTILQDLMLTVLPSAPPEKIAEIRALCAVDVEQALTLFREVMRDHFYNNRGEAP